MERLVEAARTAGIFAILVPKFNGDLEKPDKKYFRIQMSLISLLISSQKWHKCITTFWMITTNLWLGSGTPLLS